MKYIARPKVAAWNNFETCISKTKNRALRARLAACKSRVIRSSRDYDAAGTLVEWHKIKKTTKWPATDEELLNVYTRSMKKSQPGRPLYDAIIQSAPGGICPLCNHRDVSTLDHYLPKSKFQYLSVLPANLVPSCFPCNTGKLVAVPVSADTSSLHPYFDKLDQAKWLFASVVYTGNTPIIEFRVVPPTIWPSTLQLRIKWHFDNFRLAELYETQGSREIVGIKRMLQNLLQNNGPRAVISHLRGLSESWASVDPNCWQAVAYEAMAADVRFVNGGFG